MSTTVLSAYAIEAPGLADFTRRYLLHDRVCETTLFEVWQATDRNTNQTVAIKLVRPTLGEEWDAQARHELGREAAVVTALQAHPGVVKLVEYNPHLPYMALTWLNRTLSSLRNSEGRLGWRDVVKYGYDIAYTLEAIGPTVTHGDIKPSNVMLNTANRAVLIDFSFAHYDEVTPERDSDYRFGTVDYIAPEVLEFRPFDQRSDIFSFGAMLYQLLTGQPVYGTNMETVAQCYASRQEPLRPTTYVAMPFSLSRLVMNCLAFEPSERPTALQLRTALENYRTWE